MVPRVICCSVGLAGVVSLPGTVVSPSFVVMPSVVGFLVFSIAGGVNRYLILNPHIGLIPNYIIILKLFLDMASSPLPDNVNTCVANLTACFDLAGVRGMRWLFLALFLLLLPDVWKSNPTTILRILAVLRLL